jgi:uncharacterized protein (DUF433 family)
MVAIADKLGRGLYTPSEAAMYARVQTQLLGRWLKSRGGAPVIEAEYGSDDRSVSFLDFVQALAIRDIRNTFRTLSLHKIREAYSEAKNKHGVQYPFAMKHRTFLFSDGSELDNNTPRKKRRLEIVFDLGRDDNHDYVQLTGRERGNKLIAEVSELYMRDLTFDGPGGVASSYRPLRVDGNSIVMDPKIRFGEPFVESCGYTAFTLFNSYLAEGTIGAAAKAYGVQREEVELAIKYVDYLQRPTA